MSKKQYYEAHITMGGWPWPLHVREMLSSRIDTGSLRGWRFSRIDGDSNLGPGVKAYLTKQMNVRIGDGSAIDQVVEAAKVVSSLNIPVLRRKVELVIWDDRISDVPCTAEECATCPSQV